MGRIIEHRNIGRHVVVDLNGWIKKAQELEQEAVNKAKKVSASSALLIEWLGVFPEIDVDKGIPKGQKTYVNILTAVEKRIQETLQRHDQ